MQNSKCSINLLNTLTRNLNLRASTSHSPLNVTTQIATKYVHLSSYVQARNKKTGPQHVSTLFKPVPMPRNADEHDVGAEMVGKLDKAELLKILNKFTQKREIKLLCVENGLDSEFLVINTHLRIN